MNAAAAAERLGLADAYRAWLDGLAALGAPPAAVHLPAPDSLDELTRHTTLERAVVQHLRGGRHWQTRTGWLAL